MYFAQSTFGRFPNCVCPDGMTSWISTSTPVAILISVSLGRVSPEMTSGRRVDPVAECLQSTVFHPERSYADAATIVNDAGRNLACVDAITPSNPVIDFPRLDVDGECLIKMLEHRFSPRGSVHREWSVATEDPRCEYKVAEPE